MQRFYGIDLRDFWRGGVGLRRLANLTHYLPAGGAVWALSNGVPYGWTLTDVLIADLFHAWTGEEHPARPRGGSERRDAAELRSRLEAQKARLAARRSEGVND